MTCIYMCCVQQMFIEYSWNIVHHFFFVFCFFQIVTNTLILKLSMRRAEKLLRFFYNLSNWVGHMEQKIMDFGVWQTWVQNSVLLLSSLCICASYFNFRRLIFFIYTTVNKMCF